MKMRKMSKALLLCVAALVAGLLPATPAAAAPTVEFLNPSDYSPTMKISTKQDANGDHTYHLVAWVGDVPPNPAMEFEISPSPLGGDDPAVVATVEGNRVGADTWEGFLPTTTVPDGQYFLRAILYSGFTGPGTGTEVARDQVAVTVQSSDTAAANTVELSYPSNGGSVGFWRSGDAQGVGVIRGFASSGTNQVRVLYTTSAPGSDPEWTQCGSGGVSDNAFAVRCTLAEKINPASVRAVAAVANTTPPPAPPAPSADEAGDAHRVLPYLQNPASVVLNPSSATVDQAKCTAVIATVLDSFGVPVVTMNVDVHAQGPDDQLRFATMQVNGSNQHSGFQAPDAAHSGNEATAKCSTTDPAGRQGDHNVPVGDDIKHIESTGGTNNAGQFRFFLISGTKGGTQLTAWGDENDDDSLSSGEAAGYGQLGWGEPPPQPKTSLNLDPSSLTATVGECQRITAVAQQNGVAQSGQNVDIHITGPSGVEFCDASGASTTTPPDSGGHAGDLDPAQENTRHNEGTTNSSGAVVFGVVSPNAGKTSVVAWLDENNDDVQQSDETLAAGTVDWQAGGDRDITINSNRNAVRKGRRVKLFGRIKASEACANNQVVKIQMRKGGRFRTIKKTRTFDTSYYETKVRVRSTKKYRAVTPKNGPCEKAVSRAIRVRAK